MEKIDFASFTLTAIQAALKAGEILKKGFGTLFEVKEKPGRQNLVTEYDHASEACIISFIKERFPTHNFLAEESGFSIQSSQKDQILWLIDPLDGTTNFVHQLPLFTISIAAYQGREALCGVIFQPLTNELFVAEKGKGAYLNGKQLNVSSSSIIENSLCVVSFPYDLQSTPLLGIKQLLELVEKGMTIRNLGSAALALAYVAAGKVDAFWMYNLYPWDLAAGQLLIEEAGGLVTRYDKENDIHLPAHVLASNPFLHPSLIEYFHF